MEEKSIKETLFNELRKDSLNWETIEKCVTDCEPFINNVDDYGDTLLSDAICEFATKDTGEAKLKRIIQVFLNHGYDLNRNNHYNGWVCLNELCYVYSNEILDAAEILLDNGAVPFVISENDDNYEGDIIEVIASKMAYWQIGEQYCANLFEAYYAMIKAVEDGEDYHGIRSVSNCFGKVITKVEQISFSEEDKAFNKSSDCFKGAYVLWCEDIPLVITPIVSFIVNPLAIAKAIDRIDRSKKFIQIIGKTVNSLYFLSSEIAELKLNDGSYISVANNMDNTEDCFANIEHSFDAGEKLPDIKMVNRVFFKSGIKYSESCKSYSEEEVFLECGDCFYVICSTGEEDYSVEPHLICRKYPLNWFSGLRRTLNYENFSLDNYIFGKDKTLCALQLRCDDKLLYLIAEGCKKVKIMLGSELINNSDNYGSKIDFINI